MEFFTKLGLRLRIALFFALLASATIALILAGLVWLSRSLDAEAFSTMLPTAIIGAFAMLGLIAWVALKFDEHLAKPLIAIAGQLKVAAHTDAATSADAMKGQYLGLLGPAAKEVADALTEARERTRARISEAMGEASAQRGRLEALLRELPHGIIICSMDGRIILYNRRALHVLHVDEFRSGDAAASGKGVGTIGLGRNIFNIVDRSVFVTAAATLNNADNPHQALPVVFSTLDSSVTMRGHVSLHSEPDSGKAAGMTIVFDDITDELAAGIERDRLLRGSLKELDACVLETDIVQLQTRIGMARDMLSGASNSLLASAWPTADITAKRLFRGASQDDRLAETDITSTGGETIINGDSATLISLLRKLLVEAHTTLGATHMTLAASRVGTDPTITITATECNHPDGHWLDGLLADNADPLTAFLTGSEILERHRASLTLDMVGKTMTLTMTFLGNSFAKAEARRTQTLRPNDARPEFYDFDIFGTRRVDSMQMIPLSKLYCVVFDCEMTGLDVHAGHEIVSIAGARVVNGRVLTGETFDQLVNPGRRIPPASTAIHHITDDMVLDAPRINAALRAFRNFTDGHVLVAHNAAFDMAFVSKAARQTGLEFDHPVLDTVLLAAHLHGTQDSLTLDTLAERYGIVIPPEARHTALGDALATAQLFAHMIKPLEKTGVITLGDALEASRRQGALRKKQKAYS